MVCIRSRAGCMVMFHPSKRSRASAALASAWVRASCSDAPAAARLVSALQQRVDDALAHLAGRLSRKGDGDDLLGVLDNGEQGKITLD